MAMLSMATLLRLKLVKGGLDLLGIDGLRLVQGAGGRQLVMGDTANLAIWRGRPWILQTARPLVYTLLWPLPPSVHISYG